MKLKNWNFHSHLVRALVLSALQVSAAAYAQDGASGSISTEVKAPTKKSDSKMSGKWKLGFSTLDWQNANEHASSTGFGLDGEVVYKANSVLLMRIAPAVSFKTGYAQTRFGEISPRNSISMSEGYIQLTPGEVLTLQGGVINQGTFGLDTVLDGNPFPGVLEKLKLGEDYAVELKAGQSVPTSNNLESKATGAEPTPGFTAEALTISAEPKRAWLSANVTGGHWAFHNLPANVAKDSEIGGNTLTTINGKPRFKYEFEGYFYGGGAKVNFNKDNSIEAHVKVTQNTQAPDGYGAGQVAGTSMSLLMPGNFTLEPGVDWFFVESDASPAYYNSTEMGHNNRDGFAAGLGSSLKDVGIKIGAYFFDTNLINPNALQQRQQLFLFTVGTDYAKF